MELLMCCVGLGIGGVIAKLILWISPPSYLSDVHEPNHRYRGD